ncbi:MAG: hypothetical protein JSR76_05255 [Verrucomicrobia bacterium]|nr:hypothetical protein [Verrucomicrobiota bacterium]
MKNKTPTKTCCKSSNESLCTPACTSGATRTMQLVIFLPYLILLTGLFVGWSFYSLYMNVLIRFTPAILYGVIFFTVGTHLGSKEVRAWRFHKQCCRELITIPRNYSTTILIIISVILKAFFGYFYTTCTDIPCWMYVADMITASIASGFFIGRTGSFFKKYLGTYCC